MDIRFDLKKEYDKGLSLGFNTTAHFNIEFTFQRNKQQRLNEVMCVAILKLNQFQNLIDDDTCINSVPDSLLFSQSSLTKLYKRVGQLQLETLKQKATHK